MEEGASIWNSELTSLKVEQAVCEAAEEYLPKGSCVRAEDFLQRFLVGGEGGKQKEYLRDANASQTGATFYKRSASTFFSMLYWDKDINRNLAKKDICVLGSAVLFARWKEGLEYEVMLKASEELRHWLCYNDDGLKYKGGEKEQKSLFDAFMKEKMMEQQTGVEAEDMNTFKSTLLKMSPWCPLPAVIEIVINNKLLRGKITGQIRDPNVRGLLSGLLIDRGLVIEMLSIDKRHSEPQFWIGVLAHYSKDQYQANKLKTNVIMINENLVQASAQQKLSTFASTIEKTPFFKNQVLATLQGVVSDEGLKEGISTAVAEVVDKTTAKVLTNPSMQLVIAVVLGTRAGLFLAAQKRVVKAVARVLKQLLVA